METSSIFFFQRHLLLQDSKGWICQQNSRGLPAYAVMVPIVDLSTGAVHVEQRWK
jgi:hypothetical protein